MNVFNYSQNNFFKEAKNIFQNSKISISNKLYNYIPSTILTIQGNICEDISDSNEQ